MSHSGSDATRSDELLIALRKIIRAIDLHSRVLVSRVGLTGPQLLTLRQVSRAGEPAVGEVARELSLSQATITGILDRLERKGLVTRRRDEGDRRRVRVRATAEGQTALAGAPEPFQDSFVSRFSALQDWEQSQIVSSLQRIVAMMEAEDMDATPILTTGAIGAVPDGDPPSSPPV